MQALASLAGPFRRHAPPERGATFELPEMVHREAREDLQGLKVALEFLLAGSEPKNGSAPGFEEAARAAIATMEQAIAQAPSPGAAAPQPEEGHHHHHHHHHGNGRLNRLLKRCIGTSDIDEAPHAVVGAKAGVSGVVNDAGHQDRSRLQEFQAAAVPHSGGELAGDAVLATVMGGAGVMAWAAGRGERLEAGDEKRELKHLHARLLTQIAVLEADLPAPPEQVSGPQLSLRQKQLIKLRWKLEEVEFKLGHVDKKRELGRGSELAGMQMVLKAVIDLACKPAAYFVAAAAPLAGSVSGFATLPLSPGAAAAGLYMGYKAQRFNSAQLRDFRKKLDAARAEAGPDLADLPEELRLDFKRFFVDGKWASHAHRLQWFNHLLKCFTSGMAGYTAAMTASSASKIAALAIGASIAADLAASGGVIVATTAVLIGTYGFLKNHAKLHEYDEWIGLKDVEIDLELMADLAVDGKNAGYGYAVSSLKYIEAKEERRLKFLHDMARPGNQSYAGAHAHSTDTEALRGRIRDWKNVTGANALNRSLRTGGKNARAVGQAARAFAQLPGRGLQDALQAARSRYAQGAAHLSGTRLAELLDGDEVQQRLVTYMQENVASQLAIMNAVRELKIQAYGAGLEVMFSTVPTPDDPWKDMRRGLMRDAQLHTRATELQGQLEAWPAGSDQNPNLMKDMQARFLLLQQWKTGMPSETDGTPQAFARFLLKQAPQQYRQSRCRLHRGQLEMALLSTQAKEAMLQAASQQSPQLAPLPADQAA